MSFRILQRKLIPQNKVKSDVKDKKSLFKIFKFLRLILQFLGIMPIIRKSKVLNILQLIWGFIVLIVIWFNCYQISKKLPDTYTVIEKGFYLSEIFFNSIISLNIYYITFFKKSKFLKIYQNYIKLFEQLRMCRDLGFQFRSRLYCQLRKEVLVLSLLILIIYSFCISITILRSYRFNYFIIEILLAFVLPNILISLNLCLFWLTLRFISLSYAHLNAILEELKDRNNSNSLIFNISFHSSSLWYQKEFGNFEFKKFFKFPDIFITLRKISYNLDQLILEVVNIFQFVIIIEFVNTIAILTIHIFSTYKYLDNPDIHDIISFLLKIGRLTLHTFNIILVLWPNNTIIKEKCHTIIKLNSLPVGTLDMEHNICRFLLQLIVRKHSASVCDIFDLDFSFLLSIISALSTCVIFLIQIDLGAVTIVERKNAV
ncbi:uncharacterized protein ACRADG_010524 [Cochliomyia hominivorax]